MKEKGYTTGLPTYEEPTSKPKSRRFALAFGLIASVALLQYYHPPIPSLRVKDGHVYSDAVKPACPQAAPLVPERNRELWDVSNEIIGSDDFKWKAISLLAGAVNIPTPRQQGEVASDQESPTLRSPDMSTLSEGENVTLRKSRENKSYVRRVARITRLGNPIPHPVLEVYSVDVPIDIAGKNFIEHSPYLSNFCDIQEVDSERQFLTMDLHSFLKDRHPPQQDCSH
ncbi:hypothetical protein BDZ89DRAFT_1034810 [Hymenopellis radicata]|nr:hypothetical protein BDZ89DRAFT_1034810 [Hymenopellis radicata]